ncbi:MAG: metallophosphoesterase family protein [Ignavibacteria bacterium]|nr:metallophosphoesterase family protein [Ignavibacteria bacterium]
MIIGCIADIHEDIASLQAAFGALETLRCDAVFCLGDIVGFSLPFQRHCARRDANACIEMVRERCSAVVAGNHDMVAVKRIPQHRAGIRYRDNWFELEHAKRARLSRHRTWRYDDCEPPHPLTDASRDYLHSLEEYSVLAVDGFHCVISHFAYPDLSGSRVDSLRTARDPNAHFRFMRIHDCLLSITGHGHPEGFATTHRGEVLFLPFGSYRLERTQRWIVCPSVARSNRASGILTFDTATFEFNVVPLPV